MRLLSWPLRARCRAPQKPEFARSLRSELCQQRSFADSALIIEKKDCFHALKKVKYSNKISCDLPAVACVFTSDFFICTASRLRRKKQRRSVISSCTKFNRKKIASEVVCGSTKKLNPLFNSHLRENKRLRLKAFC